MIFSHYQLQNGYSINTTNYNDIGSYLEMYSKIWDEIKSFK